MNEEEKIISFMNRYFVFKKVKNVQSKQIQRLMNEEEEEERKGKEQNEEDDEFSISSHVVKTKQKIIMAEGESVLDKFKIKVHHEIPSLELGKKVIIKKPSFRKEEKEHEKEKEKEKEKENEKEKEKEKEKENEKEKEKENEEREKEFLKRLGKQVIIKKDRDRKIKITE